MQMLCDVQLCQPTLESVYLPVDVGGKLGGYDSPLAGVIQHALHQPLLH